MMPSHKNIILQKLSKSLHTLILPHQVSPFLLTRTYTHTRSLVETHVCKGLRHFQNCSWVTTGNNKEHLQTLLLEFCYVYSINRQETRANFPSSAVCFQIKALWFQLLTIWPSTALSQALSCAFSRIIQCEGLALQVAWDCDSNYTIESQ